MQSSQKPPKSLEQLKSYDLNTQLKLIEQDSSLFDIDPFDIPKESKDADLARVIGIDLLFNHKDYEQARKHFLKAIKLEDFAAHYYLYYIYKNKLGFDRDCTVDAKRELEQLWVRGNQSRSVREVYFKELQSFETYTYAEALRLIKFVKKIDISKLEAVVQQASESDKPAQIEIIKYLIRHFRNVRDSEKVKAYSLRLITDDSIAIEKRFKIAASYQNYCNSDELLGKIQEIEAKALAIKEQEEQARKEEEFKKQQAEKARIQEIKLQQDKLEAEIDGFLQREKDSKFQIDAKLEQKDADKFNEEIASLAQRLKKTLDGERFIRNAEKLQLAAWLQSSAYPEQLLKIIKVPAEIYAVDTKDLVERRIGQARWSARRKRLLPETALHFKIPVLIVLAVKYQNYKYFTEAELNGELDMFKQLYYLRLNPASTDLEIRQNTLFANLVGVLADNTPIDQSHEQQIFGNAAIEDVNRVALVAAWNYLKEIKVEALLDRFRELLKLVLNHRYKGGVSGRRILPKEFLAENFLEESFENELDELLREQIKSKVKADDDLDYLPPVSLDILNKNNTIFKNNEVRHGNNSWKICAIILLYDSHFPIGGVYPHYFFSVKVLNIRDKEYFNSLVISERDPSRLSLYYIILARQARRSYISEAFCNLLVAREMWHKHPSDILEASDFDMEFESAISYCAKNKIHSEEMTRQFQILTGLMRALWGKAPITDLNKTVGVNKLASDIEYLKSFLISWWDTLWPKFKDEMISEDLIVRYKELMNLIVKYSGQFSSWPIFPLDFQIKLGIPKDSITQIEGKEEKSKTPQQRHFEQSVNAMLKLQRDKDFVMIPSFAGGSELAIIRKLSEENSLSFVNREQIVEKLNFSEALDASHYLDCLLEGHHSFSKKELKERIANCEVDQNKIIFYIAYARRLVRDGVFIYTKETEISPLVYLLLARDLWMRQPNDLVNMDFFNKEFKNLNQFYYSKCFESETDDQLKQKTLFANIIQGLWENKPVQELEQKMLGNHLARHIKSLEPSLLAVWKQLIATEVSPELLRRYSEILQLMERHQYPAEGLFRSKQTTHKFPPEFANILKYASPPSAPVVAEETEVVGVPLSPRAAHAFFVAEPVEPSAPPLAPAEDEEDLLDTESRPEGQPAR